jgi:hypothetical protein
MYVTMWRRRNLRDVSDAKYLHPPPPPMRLLSKMISHITRFTFPASPLQLKNATFGKAKVLKETEG